MRATLAAKTLANLFVGRPRTISCNCDNCYCNQAPRSASGACNDCFAGRHFGVPKARRVVV